MIGLVEESEAYLEWALSCYEPQGLTVLSEDGGN